MSRCSSDKQGHFSITDTLEKMWKNEIAGLCFESPSPGGMLFVCLFFLLLAAGIPLYFSQAQLCISFLLLLYLCSMSMYLYQKRWL